MDFDRFLPSISPLCSEGVIVLSGFSGSSNPDCFASTSLGALVAGLPLLAGVKRESERVANSVNIIPYLAIDTSFVNA